MCYSSRQSVDSINWTIECHQLTPVQNIAIAPVPAGAVTSPGGKGIAEIIPLTIPVKSIGHFHQALTSLQ